MFRMYPVMVPKGQKQEEKFSEDERDAAKDAARAALPRVYTLEGIASATHLKFIALGCQGTGTGAQADVANAIHQFIQNNPQEKPDFILLLGDNLYPKGVKSPRSSQFENSFQKPYRSLIENNIPFFIITGNHDYNMRDETALATEAQSKAKQLYSSLLKSKPKPKPECLPASTNGIDQILNEVAYTYLPDSKGTTKEKIERYKSETLKLNRLPAWNMPARYYALDAGDTRIICLDSSTYIADYLTQGNEGQTPENNQALWLEAVTADAKNDFKQCILAMHHPAYSPGKRAFKNDLSLYLSKTQRIKIREAFSGPDKHSTPYNAYLSACLDAQQLKYDLVLTAHDHNQYYYNNRSIKQLTLGGGGGPLQVRSEFEHQDALACFIKDYGFGMIKTKLNEPIKIKFSIHSLHQPTLFFSNENIKAQQNDIENENSTKVIKAVEAAATNYFKFIASKQTADRKVFLFTNLSHGHHEIECAHQAWNLVHAKDIPDHATLVKSLYAIVRKTKPVFADVPQHAFSRMLDDALAREFDAEITLRSLAKSEAKPSVNLQPL